MDKFGAAAAGAGGEIIGLNERDTHTPHGCIAEDACTGNSPADDQNVEPFPGNLLEELRP